MNYTRLKIFNFYISEFRDLVHAETYVDMDRLRDMSRHGIPDDLRGEVWKYLLQVSSPDRTDEVTKLKRIQMSYDKFDVELWLQQQGICFCIFFTKIDKRTTATNNSNNITSSNNNNNNNNANNTNNKSNMVQFVNENKTLLHRIQREIAKQYDATHANNNFRQILLTAQQSKQLLQGKRAVFEHVLLAYLHYNDVMYEPAFVNMLAPIVISVEAEHDIFYCFQTVMNHLPFELHHHASNQQSKYQVNYNVGKLLMLFRCTQPELYANFEDDEVEANDWAVSWCRYLLARDLPLSCVCRYGKCVFVLYNSY